MKRAALVGLIVLSSFAGGFAAQKFPAIAFAQPGVVVGHIDAESITLRKQGSDRSVRLCVTDNAAGIFVTGKDGRVISIVDVDTFAAVGIYASKQAQDGGGFSIALVGDKGGGWQQFVDNDRNVTCLTKGKKW